MSKFLVMTDIHLTLPPETIIGLDPVARFSQALQHAARHHPDAERLILTGDLTHHGQPEAFAMLRTMISQLPWPVSLMLGNHDLRAPFLAIFPEAPRDENGFVQQIIDLPDLRLICLDTLDEEPEIEHAGLICPARLEWLKRALDEAPEHGAMVLMHHPPVDTGFDGMDEIGLSNQTEVRALLESHPKLRHVMAGHIHRSIWASMAGVPVTILKSTCHQMPMALGDPDCHSSVDEPGAYGIVLTSPRDIIVHSEDFTLPEQQVRAF